MQTNKKVVAVSLAYFLNYLNSSQYVYNFYVIEK